ncbi:MAG TPA: carboxypeptidase regulatory-like domain-containing protein, partial [Terriglobales bacterium]|nr:carboxypeptidase regulatory-like domain-containing protein [Terriglobales bacterium]
MTLSRVLKPFSLVFLVLILTMTAFAQRETGQITGTVMDATGAVVPNAKITITNPATGVVARNLVTNADGFYTATNLLPAAYEIKVEAQGFQSALLRTTIMVGGSIEVNATLKVAAAGSQTVEVTAADVAQVNTENQTLATNVTEKQITELPTMTRDPYALVAVSGNVSESDPDGRGVGYSINGQRSASTDILLDGGENVDLFSASIGQSVPLDSVQEFSVTTNGFTADMGRASGGVVNVATKSGTNALHGSAYEFYRGSALTAQTYSNSVDGVTKPNFVRNQFGFSVGGPVIKNKLFFFTNTEWIRVRSMASDSVLVPNPSFIALSNANTQSYFSQYGSTIANATPTVTAYDLRNCGQDLTHPGGDYCVSAGVLSAVPDAQTVFDVANYSYPANSGGGDPQNQYMIVGRADWNVSDRTSLYGRFAEQHQVALDGANASSPYSGYDTSYTNKNYNYLVNLTHSFSPTLVTQSKVIYNRLTNLQPLGERSPAPTLYVGPTVASLLNGKYITFPGYLPWSPGSAIPFGGPQNLYQFYQDISWAKGKHQWRFGAQYVHTRDNRIFGAYENPVEALSTTGSKTTALNNLYAGNIAQFSAAINPQGKFPCVNNPYTGREITPDCTVNLPVSFPDFGRHNRYHDFAWYVQDTWKVSKRLTLNAGLRWEYYGVQHNNDPKLDSNFYYGSGTTFAEKLRNGSMQIAPDSPVGGLWAPDKNNFGPRVGMAWDVFGNGKTSLRGGYGISYERNFGNVTFNVIQNPPAYAVLNLIPGDISQTTMPIYTDLAGPLGGSGTKALPGTSTRNVSPDIRTGYSHSWSASIDHELMKNTVLSVEYSGSKGNKLYSIENINRPGAGNVYMNDDPLYNADGDPTVLSRLNYQYTSMNNRADRGLSSYNGMNVGFRTNNLLNQGVDIVMNYTYSHAIDNLSSSFSSSSNNFNLGLMDPFNPGLDRGNADFDQRQRVTLSAVWNMPYLKNHSNAFARHIFGGWSLAPMFTAHSGSPYTIWDCTNGNTTCVRWDPVGAYSRTGNGNGEDEGGNEFAWLTLPSASVEAGNWNGPLGITDFGMCGQGDGVSNPKCAFPSTMTPRNAFKGPGAWNMNLG